MYLAANEITNTTCGCSCGACFVCVLFIVLVLCLVDSVCHCDHLDGEEGARCYAFHYENTPIQIYSKFRVQKLKIFKEKILIFFTFLLKNIDCGYSLEPPRRGGSNEYHNLCF